MSFFLKAKQSFFQDYAQKITFSDQQNFTEDPLCFNLIVVMSKPALDLCE